MKTTSSRISLASHARRALALLSIISLFGAAPAAFAADATIAEMLELGIYSEETKGDLPAAIKLYEQIVDEADANQALAAQAQFRLAMCRHKQGDYVAATAGFEKLVREYPDQTELVSLANEYLAEGAALLPVPWVNGEELQYAIRLPAGPRMGLARWTARADTLDGRKIWRFQSQARGPAQQWSRIEVDAATFKPIHCLWKISVMGEADTTYTADGADVKMSGKDDVRHITLEQPVYDNEQACYLIRRLPLADDYQTTLTVFSGLVGGNVVQVPLRVAGRETVTVPAGTFECFKVILNVAMTEQTLWYTTDEHRYGVRLDANGAVVELTRVANVADAEPVTFHDDTFGFSLTLPAGWMADRMRPDDTQRTVLMLLDPQGNGAAQLSVQGRSHFDAEDVASARAWAGQQIEQGKKHVTRFDLREDSWQDLTVDGQPAVSFVADIVQAPHPATQTMSGAWFLEGDNAVEFRYATMPEDFDAFRSAFAAVLAGFHGE